MGFPIFESQHARGDAVRDFGRVKDCSSNKTRCIRFGAYQLVIPPEGRRNFVYEGFVYRQFSYRGDRIVHAKCASIVGGICRTDHNQRFPQIRYRYSLNSRGGVTQITIFDSSIEYKLKLESSEALRF